MIAGAAIAVAYKFAPTADDDVYLTRWIAMYKTHRDEWMSRNAHHTVMQMDFADQGQLLNDARRPVMQRLRYPQ